MADVQIIITATDRASGTLKSISNSTGDLLKTIAKLGAGAAAFGAAFAAAMAVGKRGADVQQLASSFDGLIDKVGASKNLLDQLREASRGTISDMGLMSSTATLLAGTSGDLATALADATPRLLEIAKAANKLNPSLGDTAFLYNSIATGVKRASPLILDNLGLTIRIGDANESYAESIGKTVDQLTAEEQKMALLNATLEAGNTLIEQAGGNADSAADSFARLNTAWQNAADTASTQLAPATSYLADLLVDRLNKGSEYTAQVQENLRHNFSETAAQMDIAANAAGNWIVQQRGAVTATESLAETVQATSTTLSEGTGLIWNQVPPMAALRREAQGLAEALDAAKVAQQGWAESAATDLQAGLEQAGVKGEDLRAALGVVDEQLGTSQITAFDYRNAVQQITEEFSKTGDVAAFGDAIEGLADQFGPATEKIADLETRLRNVYTQLFRLTNNQWTIRVGYDIATPPTVVGAPRQHGGDVFPGVAYPVGEAGPELFVPSRPGTIVPNSVVQNFHNIVRDDLDVEMLARRAAYYAHDRR